MNIIDLIWKQNAQDSNLLRTKIFGGWLVRHKYYQRQGMDGESMSFVPDPEHKWHWHQYD